MTLIDFLKEGKDDILKHDVFKWSIKTSETPKGKTIYSPIVFTSKNATNEDQKIARRFMSKNYDIEQDAKDELIKFFKKIKD